VIRGPFATKDDVLQARKSRGLTQKQAAAICEVHETTWQLWERGITKKVRWRLLQAVLDLPRKKKR